MFGNLVLHSNNNKSSNGHDYEDEHDNFHHYSDLDVSDNENCNSDKTSCPKHKCIVHKIR